MNNTTKSITQNKAVFEYERGYQDGKKGEKKTPRYEYYSDYVQGYKEGEKTFESDWRKLLEEKQIKYG